MTRREWAIKMLVECAEHYADPKLKNYYVGGGTAQHALDAWHGLERASPLERYDTDPEGS